MTLSVIAVVNVVMWLFLARRLRRAAPTLVAIDLRDRRRQLTLAGVYVVGCAFRSLLPRADVSRSCFVDSFWASVFVGRSVATVAELCFALQIALALRAIARSTGATAAIVLSHLTLPLIAIAEICSWHAVLTTNYRGNIIEQSLWTVNGVLMCSAAGGVLPRTQGALRRLLGLCLAVGVGYVCFMLLVDLPMYAARFNADEAAGRHYLGLAEGLRDVIGRRVVTFRWIDWHEELAWMFLYFSVVVWFSLALVNAPGLWHAKRQRVAPSAAS
jgi:hypothetical protein